MFTEEEKEFIQKVLSQLSASLSDPATANNSKIVLSILEKLKDGDKKT